MSLFIGLDLGGTNLKYGVGDEKGQILIKKIKPSRAQESQAIIFDNMISAIEELISETRQKIQGIGVGTPGSVNFTKGQLNGNTPNLPNWTDAPIKKILESKFNMPVWADNDANVMALAEARNGAAKGFTDVVCFTIGTGIGGGIILNNQIYRGANFSAAEVGHIIVQKDGKRCNCGNFGCLEAYASAPAMVERYWNKLTDSGINSDLKSLRTEVIFDKANGGDRIAIDTINETCDYMGTGVASIVNALNPQVVVIGGGVADAGDTFIRQIETVIKKKALKANAQYLKVLKAKLGNEAGVVGAIFLAAEN
jgi:glucokinase